MTNLWDKWTLWHRIAADKQSAFWQSARSSTGPADWQSSHPADLECQIHVQLGVHQLSKVAYCAFPQTTFIPLGCRQSSLHGCFAHVTSLAVSRRSPEQFLNPSLLPNPVYAPQHSVLFLQPKMGRR